MYLVIESADGGMHSYRHPDPQMRGQLDIVVKPDEPLICEETEGFSWMRVPWFNNGIKLGHITVTKQEEMPSFEPLVIPPELILSNPMYEAIAEQISQEPRKPQFELILDMKPSFSSDSLVSVEWLKTEYTAFLKNLLYREEHGKKRQELIDIINAKLEEVKRL